MVRDALANQERGKVLGEVVAIMEKEVIGLQALIQDHVVKVLR